MKPIDVLVRAQAQRTPDAIALRHGSSLTTYRDLETRSNSVARTLIAQGVVPGDRVGLCVGRSAELPISLLGILKAGAAYVPLDPSYPEARLNFMIDDSRPRLIVASSEHATRFGGTVPTVQVEEAQEPSGLPGSGHVSGLIRPEGPAYVIYTSGSSGVPKGVVMPHRALLNLIQWQLAQPGFSEPARTIQFAPVSFDAHYPEIFSTLPRGGSLVMVDEEARLDPFRLLPLLADQKVERIFLPFVALQQMAEVAISFDLIPGSLRDVVTAGEQLQSTPALKEFFSRIPRCRLHNHYGPSETHVVTAYTLPEDPGTWPVLPAIGPPIGNVEAYVLDEDLRPVPDGAEGELCFSGVCIADGYWGRPDLTAEKFVASPGGDGSMYRTGDMGKMDAQGDFHFLGRKDDQVKIRGHRVELGEVEAAIMGHPAVSECAVCTTGTTSGDRSLSAFLVLDSNRPQVRTEGPRLADETLTAWKAVWDGTYSAPGSAMDPEAGMAFWRSSYDGTALSEAEMGEWADVTVNRILANDPKRVLEIGCGGGLILRRLAPECQGYHGVDFSRAAIEDLQNEFSGSPPCGVFDLAVAPAHDLPSSDVGPYDAVVMNSVTQHFPGLPYLGKVLEGILAAVPRGRIFIGDVSNWRLRKAFHTAVEDSRAQADEPLGQLRGRVERRLGADRELSIDPDFFLDLPQRYPAISRVDVQLKGGRYRNELSDFRYDVVLEVGGDPAPALPVDWHAWGENGLDPTSLAARMKKEGGLVLGISGIPDERVFEPAQANRLLRIDGLSTVGEWREAWRRESDGDPTEKVLYHPEDFRALQVNPAYDVHVSGSREPGLFDVVIYPTAAEGGSWTKPPDADSRSVGTLSSNPANAALLPDVARDLDSALRDSLPEYMVPKEFIPLVRLPRTPSGKLARGMLPPLEARRALRREGWIPPKEGTEKELMALWESLLAVEGLSVDDSFFEVGGNSILSVRLLVQIRQTMNRDPGLVALFEHPTIRSMAAFLDSDPAPSMDDPKPVSARGAKQREVFQRMRGPKRAGPDTAGPGGGDKPRPESGRPADPGTTASEAPVELVDWLREGWDEYRNEPAVLHGDSVLSFADLDSRSDTLATRLKADGVRPGDLVGICLERTGALVVSILAIWKCGAAYLPLDPGHPPGRLSTVIEEAQVEKLVTEPSVSSSTASFQGQRLLVGDPDGARAQDMVGGQDDVSEAHHPGSSFATLPNPDGLAYVMFTSGSTGVPKGVEVLQGGVRNFLNSMIERPGASSSDRLLSVTTPAFDISVLELFMLLRVGGRIVIASGEQARDGRALRELIQDHTINLMQGTPNTWRILLDAGWQGGESFRVICGGEPFPQDLAQELASTCGEVWNAYGPTETTIWSTLAKVTDPEGPIPIGTAIDETQVFILDPDMKQVPRGDTGELWIGGAGVARGYRNRPDLTAERFVPSPFSDNPQDLIYRTGDLAVSREDGALAYHGRVDDQIKIRGFRIEPGEIEAALSSHESVKQAVVSTRGEVENQQLVAYFVLEEGAGLTSTEGREYLGEHLPEYMVPPFLVPLDSLPLMPNGKIDRNALPDPLFHGGTGETELQPPETPEEILVGEIWQEILGLDTVYRTENFLDLGGHSLLAMRALTAIEKKTGKRPSVQSIFFHTLEDVARELETGGAE